MCLVNVADLSKSVDRSIDFFSDKNVIILSKYCFAKVKLSDFPEALINI